MARITRRGLNSSESEVPTNCSVIERARIIWVMLKDVKGCHVKRFHVKRSHVKGYHVKGCSVTWTHLGNV